MRTTKKGPRLRLQRRKRLATVRQMSLEDFEQGLGNKLRLEVAQRAARALPEASLRPPKDLELPLKDLFEPSEVSVWMMVVQLSNLLGWSGLALMLGAEVPALRSFMNHRSGLGRPLKRSIWLLWSLHFHPSNLADTFTMTTFGFFNAKATGVVADFERNRVKRGFMQADFGRYAKDTTHLKAAMRTGCIFYRSVASGEVVLIEPAIPVQARPVPNHFTDDELREIFQARDSGVTQDQLGARFKVSQPYLSLICKQRREILMSLIPCLSYPSPVDDEGLAEIRRVAGTRSNF